LTSFFPKKHFKGFCAFLQNNKKFKSFLSKAFAEYVFSLKHTSSRFIKQLLIVYVFVTALIIAKIPTSRMCNKLSFLFTIKNAAYIKDESNFSQLLK
jgi:hypothetical protein